MVRAGRRLLLVGALVVLLSACSGGGAADRSSGAPEAASWSLHQLRGDDGCLTPAGPAGQAGCATVVGAGGGIMGAGIAVTPDGRSVYVVGDGALAVLTRVPRTGRLVQPPGIAGCIAREPRAGAVRRCAGVEGSFWPAAVAVSNDGRSVYLASAGVDYGGGKSGEWTRLDVFERHAPYARLHPVTGPGGCFADPDQVDPPPACTPARGLHLPVAVTTSPDGRHVYVGSYGGIVVFRRTSDGGLRQLPGRAGCALTKRETTGCAHRPPGSGGTLALAMASDGRTLYAVLQGAVRNAWRPPVVVLALRRDRLTGALSKLPGSTGCAAGRRLAGCRVHAGLTGRDWAVTVDDSGDGRDLYFANGRVVLDIERAASGGLQAVHRDAVLRPAPDLDPVGDGLTVAADGRSVHVAANGALFVFDRAASTGALRLVQCFSQAIRGCERARGLGEHVEATAITPDGRHAYTSGIGDSIAAFERRAPT